MGRNGRAYRLKVGPELSLACKYCSADQCLFLGIVTLSLCLPILHFLLFDIVFFPTNLRLVTEKICCVGIKLMAGIPRPASGLANKKHSMRPPMSRPTAPVRSQSSAPSLHSRNQSGATSPDESIISTSTNKSQSTSPKKRKHREVDTDGGQETNIHVVVRCRGRNDREVRENSGVVVSTDGVRGKFVELSMGASALSNKTYHFDKVFSPAADQSMIFDDVVTPILGEVRPDSRY